jgi:hypothetical protein
MFPALSQPSVGDLDQDGTPDVIVSGGSLSLAGILAGSYTAKPFQALLSMWSGKTGKMFPGSPVVLEDIAFFVNHAIADVNDDGFPEVITTSATYHVRAVDACGREAAGFPKFTGGWNVGTPAVGDIDGDSAHTLEVVATSRQGYLFAWKTKGRETGVVQWESYHHDNANTGDYSTKLGQGVLRRATKPLDCSEAAAPQAERFDAGGCRTSSSTRNGGGWALVVCLGGLVAALRRRASRRGQR